jgi:hypothetical protein
MAVGEHTEPDPVGLAEKILALLEQGRFTATYKYAVLLGLMDLCLEQTGADGTAPTHLSTRDLAVKVVELYWPHTVPYAPGEGMEVLRQNQSHAGSQAEIVRLIERFRNASRWGPWAPLARVKVEQAGRFDRLIDRVEWKLVEMPLPKLQRFGNRLHPFLYELTWDDDIRHAEIRAFRAGDGGRFDGQIRLQPGVGRALTRLNGVLRPVIRRQWALLVAQTNNLPEARLEEFLFGTTRTSTEAVREPLQDLQQGRCFYCEVAFRARRGWHPEVDHFIPWSRYPDNGLANLVVAHGRCNADKRDFLAATRHVSKWLQRNNPSGSHFGELVDIADRTRWTVSRREIQGVATAVYGALPADAELWRQGKEFEFVQPEVLNRSFRAYAPS